MLSHLGLVRHKTTPPLDGSFDAAFYAKQYPDLRHLPDAAALWQHFICHGREEGRHGTHESYLASLIDDYGPLPDGFDAGTYRTLHRDLDAQIEDDWEAVAHYLKHGRAEGRAYRRIPAGFENAPDAVRAGFEALLAAHGLSAGPWLRAFDLVEFVQMNADWIVEPPRSRADGLRLFVEEGVERLAPIGAGTAFDPDFYRTAYPRDAGLGDADLYRHWLNVGLPGHRPPNEACGVRDLLGQPGFPACFDETAYRRRAGGVSIGPGRLAALQHWVETGFGAGITSCIAGPDAAALYAAVGWRLVGAGRAADARRAFDLALALDAPTAERLHGRGEALRGLGLNAAAAEDYRRAAALPGASVWSHVHAASLLAGLGETREAMALIRTSSPIWIRHAAWRRTAWSVATRAFEASSEVARAAYRTGERREADRILDGALARLTEDLPLAQPLPAALPPARSGTIVLLASLDLPQCVHYRVEQRRRQLEHGGWTVRVFGQSDAPRFREALHEAAAAIFYRVPAFPEVVYSIAYARALGLPTFYDIDDLIFDAAVYPDPFESFEGQITRADYAGLAYGVPLFRFAMGLCDEGIASTPALAEAMRPVVRSGRCHVVANGLDQRNEPFLRRPPRPVADRAAPVTIFYGSGTKAHNQDFTELAGPALLTMLARHPQVRLVIAGHLRLDRRFAEHAGRIHQIGFTADVAEYWEILSAADINLAVLLPGPVADAKSEIKWLEAATCGIPSVVSGTRTYRDVLVDGEDVLVAESADGFTAALERLVTDPELRQRIGAAARRKARTAYALDAAAGVLAGILPRPAPPPLPATARRPRLLLVNAFFPPQTVGGATRVVRDNVDHLLDHAAGRFDLAVAASDEGVEPAGQSRIDAYRGIPVLRISTPAEVNMDWRPFNPAVGELFGRFLDRFEPDLVHVHAVQRLTASCVEETRTRAIPYLVTVHDGWWISDHQFLVDRDGREVRPDADPMAVGTDTVRGPVAAIVRRRRLAALLNDARAVLSVSATFAEVYRAAGIAGTRAVPNGVPALAPVPRPPNATGRVRLGHVGGLEVHKGASLVEAVLRTTPFSHLSLRIVDLARDGGYRREEIWGTTPVEIVGPVPQAEVPRLYAGLDVLLVPSLWPESFGLVAREAGALGLWVVASDRGAMGEDVEDGVDGFVVDVTTPRGLREVLSRIDGDPARFRSPPPRTRPIRTAAQQGADLLALYGTLLSAPAATAPLSAAE
ncbi:glycosyltransferase [Methylobacterium oryzihabitans]|uniref:glycosyltransferase n=1 Tax=Methylobacterium oryzihabitans TaxID=2499852 RepID=UPI001FE81F96|nr:glycosyltransferase [Methylobacterium oryzihabitans]